MKHTGIVMSRTRLGQQFCFIIWDFNRLVQVRPLLCEDRQYPKFHLRTPESRNFYENIWPGRLISYTTSIAKITPRITHPEDTLITKLELLNRQLPENELYTTAQVIGVHPSVKSMFPTIDTNNGKFFVPADVSLSQSVGYVMVKDVKIEKSRSFNGNVNLIVSFTDDEGLRYAAPLKDQFQSRFIFENFEPQNTDYNQQMMLRLSLASPIDSDFWKIPRCYLQVSRLHFPPH